MNLGLIAFAITIAVIISAMVTRKCTESLYAGTLVAGIFLFGKNFAAGWFNVLIQEVADNTWLWLLLGLFGSLTCLFETSKSTIGFSKAVSKFCKTKSSCKFAALLLGILIFIDDYLNVMTVGLCMKKSFDDKNISREELAFLVDCTGTPVCILVPLSSWAAFYLNMFSNYGCTSYIPLLKYMFYPMFVMIFLVMLCMGILPKADSMRRSSYSVGQEVFEGGSFFNFLIPVAVLVAVSIACDEILLGIASSIAVCLLLYVPTGIMNVKTFTGSCIKGFAKTVDVFFLLTGCYMLKNITAQMNMGQFIINLTSSFINASLLPGITFLIASFLSFSTGCVWGTSALIVPIIMPLALSCGAQSTMVMAAIICGGVFGAQACVYSDTTVMSASSSGISNTDHAFSQLPYICTAAAVSFVLYIALGFIL